MVEAGHHEGALLGEDARLGAVGQDHTPTLQPGADAGAVDDKRLASHRDQGCPEFMRPPGRAQLQGRRYAFKSNGVDAAVVLRNECPRSLRVAAAAGPLERQLVAHERVGRYFAAFAGVDDKDFLHIASPDSVLR